MSQFRRYYYFQQFGCHLGFLAHIDVPQNRSTTTRKLDLKNIGVAVGILSLCALELKICLGAISPSPVAGRRDHIQLSHEVNHRITDRQTGCHSYCCAVFAGYISVEDINNSRIKCHHASEAAD